MNAQANARQGDLPAVLVAAHEGFAEFQILPCLALLRGHVRVVTAGPSRAPVTSENALRVLPACAWDELDEPRFAAVLLAGALDMQAACENEALHALLQRCAAGGAVIGATSGGPLVLHAAGLLAGRDYATSMSRDDCAQLGLDVARYRDAAVVVDGPIVTAPGWATLPFAEAIARQLDINVTSRVAYFRKGLQEKP